MLAEEVGHCWKTSRTSPDTWFGRTEKLLEKHGGRILSSGYGRADGREAYMLSFGLEGRVYKIMWPVLESKSNDQSAARIQAVTLMHHDVKARIVTGLVLGLRVAFFQFLTLPDGRTMAEVADPELMDMLPDLRRPLLVGGDVVDAEWREG